MTKRLLSEIVDSYAEDPTTREISVRFQDILSCERRTSPVAQRAQDRVQHGGTSKSALFFQSNGLTEDRYQVLISALKLRAGSAHPHEGGALRNEIHSDNLSLSAFSGTERFDGETTTEHKKELLRLVKEPEYGFQVYLSSITHKNPSRDDISESESANRADVDLSLIHI